MEAARQESVFAVYSKCRIVLHWLGATSCCWHYNGCSIPAKQRRSVKNFRSHVQLSAWRFHHWKLHQVLWQGCVDKHCCRHGNRRHYSELPNVVKKSWRLDWSVWTWRLSGKCVEHLRQPCIVVYSWRFIFYSCQGWCVGQSYSEDSNRRCCRSRSQDSSCVALAVYCQRVQHGRHNAQGVRCVQSQRKVWCFA